MINGKKVLLILGAISAMNDIVKEIKDIIKKRNSLIKMLDRGEIPAECVGCFDLKEQEIPKPLILSQFSKPPKANMIIVKHFKLLIYQALL